MAKGRVGYIDQFRGLATIFMIETHILNALLLTSLRSNFVFKGTDFLNGLVAPSFLFVAGFSFTLAINRKGDSYRKFSPEFWKHMRRLLYIWVTGYMLHIPYFSLMKSVHGSTSEDMTAFFAIDILQCIAATLVGVHFLRVLIKRDRVFNIVLWCLFWFFIIMAPVVAIVDPALALPQFFGQYFDRLHGSLFPLFPWASFLIAGIIASQKITYEKGSMLASKLFPVGGILVVVGIGLALLHNMLIPQVSMTDYSIGWFLLRLGVLLLVLKGIIIYEGNRRFQWSAVKIFGRESFMVYVAHILIVYGSSAKNPSFAETIGSTLNYLQCFGIFAVLTATMFVMAYIWSTLKKKNYELSRLIQYACVAGFFYYFIKNPF